MYKSDRRIIEECIIPSVLEALIISHIKQVPSVKEGYGKAPELLKKDLESRLGGNEKLAKRLLRIEKTIISWFNDNNWQIRKALMLVSYLASALEEGGYVEFSEDTRQILVDINNVVIEAYDDPDLPEIKMIDESAGKQTLKVLYVIRREGYFND